MAGKNSVSEAALREEMAVMQKMISNLQEQLNDTGEVSQLELIEQEMKLYDDPFSKVDPLRIFGELPGDDEYPEGYVLGWKSPDLRSRGSMRGWRYIKWDDPVGQKISAGQKAGKPVIAEVPPVYEGSRDLDNLVRCGDLALAMLPKRIFKARVRLSELESAKQRGQLTTTKTERLAQGVKMDAGGLTEDKKPMHDINRKRVERSEDIGKDYAAARMPIAVAPAEIDAEREAVKEK